jgi:hypothetical protein
LPSEEGSATRSAALLFLFDLLTSFHNKGWIAYHSSVWLAGENPDENMGYALVMVEIGTHFASSQKVGTIPLPQ